MPKEEIKKLVENSKKTIEHDHDNFVQSIKGEIKSFKKTTLEKI